jgi:hypothetical protein
MMRGDLDRAEGMHLKDLAVEEELGRKKEMAKAYVYLGAVAYKRRDVGDVRKQWGSARDLYAEIGMLQEGEKIQGWLDKLPRAAAE